MVEPGRSGQVVTCPTCGGQTLYPDVTLSQMIKLSCGCYWQKQGHAWQALGPDEGEPSPSEGTLAKAQLVMLECYPATPVHITKDAGEAEWAQNMLGNLRRSAREDVSWADLLRDRDAVRLVKALGLDRPQAETVKAAKAQDAEEVAWARQTLAMLDEHLTKGWDELLAPADLERLEKAMRLYDLAVEEVSLVGKPANRRKFLLIKDDE
ncbi:MAG: hypothetical protein ACYC5O_22810, partial [Anaerolineae bacterium]